MKQPNPIFTDVEFQRLRKAKRLAEAKTSLSWAKFFMIKCCNGVSVKYNKHRHKSIKS